MAVFTTGQALVTSESQISAGIITNASISNSAAIAKSKVDTAGTWVLADLPTITQSSTVQITTAVTTTSTSYVDVTGLTLTLTTGATSVIVLAEGNADASGAAVNGSLQIVEDSTSLDAAGIYAEVNFSRNWSIVQQRTPTAASHTYKVQFKTDAQTFRVPTGNTTPAVAARITVVELKK